MVAIHELPEGALVALPKESNEAQVFGRGTLQQRLVGPFPLG